MDIATPRYLRWWWWIRSMHTEYADVQHLPRSVECDVIPLAGGARRWISSHSTGGAGRIGFGHTFCMAELNSVEHVDVLIVGAGLSGVGAGCHLTMSSPGKSFAILESRDAIGGTWDLFQYPGIRSDSDMYTLGYSFRPWKEAKAIADGPSILNYIRETARDFGVEEKIRFHHKVVRAAWSSDDSQWTVEVERTDTGERVQMTAGFVLTCTGYYRYDEGYTPEFAGIDDFRGQLVHPQHWPDDLDYAGKRVVVIGSGATAVTLVPAMADEAAHVTMLQRSPTYVVSLPAKDPLA